MAEIEADVRSRANRRTVVRTVAAALAVLGLVALAVHPAGRTHAEARVTVPSPLIVGDVIGAIRTYADGATATAHGHLIVVSSDNAKRDVARADAEALARAGLDAARQRFVAVETRLAQTATTDRTQAATQLAALVSHTGLTDPESALRQHVAAVQSLKAQLARAAAAGQPVAAISAQLAVNQQDVFELQLQVTRRAELTKAESTAQQREVDAGRAITAATRAVSPAAVEVSDHTTGIGTGIGVAAGIVALVLAGIAFLLGERLPHPASAEAEAGARSEPVTAGDRADQRLAESEPAALEPSGRRESRYLEFYRALAPTPPDALDPAPASVDLAHEEAVEEALKGGGEPAAQAGEPPQVAGDANATRLSR